MLSGRALARWLRREIWGTDIRVPHKPPKQETRGPARNYRYRAWIRSLPCAVCGITPSHAAHTGPHAIGQKSSDYTVIPLCGDHHLYASDSLHRSGRAEFERRFDLDIAALVRRLNRLWWNQWKLGNE